MNPIFSQLHFPLVNGQIPIQDWSNASVLELVVMRVKIRAKRRLAWLEELGKHQTPERENLGNPWFISLDERDRPELETAWYQQTEQIHPLNNTLQHIEAILASDRENSLHQLSQLFRLSQKELDILQTCLALAIDPNLSLVYGYLQLNTARSYPTEALAARLFGYGYQSLWQPNSPLAVWKFVHQKEGTPGEPNSLAIDPVIIDWIQGELGLETIMMGRIRSVSLKSPLTSWPVIETTQTIEQLLQQESAIRVQVMGNPGGGRRTFAGIIAKNFGLETLSVDTSNISDEDWPDFFVRVQRLAIMGRMALVWTGKNLHRSWPNYIIPAPLQFITCEQDQKIPVSEQIVDYYVELPSPSITERRQLWQEAIPELAVTSKQGFNTLVSRYALNPGDIAAVGRRNPKKIKTAIAFARESTRQNLGEWGHLLDCPFTWEDLVLADKVRHILEDFTFEARERSQFWESANAKRLFPRGTGLVGLFSGSPGTGKTMAAQVIAADLGLDLFRIDLATVVSKYIGETAKHLKQIFVRASRMNGVLLFDEADALFSKRTEVKDSHDRHANGDTSYLLQLLEEYRGIAILASNKKQNLDAAFTRRIRYIIDFPRPDVNQRQHIWQQVIGELCGDDICEQLNSVIGTLAEGVDLSGAQIKNAVLASIFIARRSGEPLAMPHLLQGVERELSKEGRSLGSRERGRFG